MGSNVPGKVKDASLWRPDSMGRAGFFWERHSQGITRGISVVLGCQYSCRMGWDGGEQGWKEGVQWWTRREAAEAEVRGDHLEDEAGAAGDASCGSSRRPQRHGNMCVHVAALHPDHSTSAGVD